MSMRAGAASHMRVALVATVMTVPWSSMANGQTAGIRGRPHQLIALSRSKPVSGTSR